MTMMDKEIDIRAGYRVPEGYFESFQARMSEMASHGGREIHPRVRVMRFVRLAAGVAAMLLLCVGIFWIAAGGDDVQTKEQNALEMVKFVL